MNEVLAMMGRQSPYQYKFFMKGFSLEKRARKDHAVNAGSDLYNNMELHEKM